MTNKNVGNGLDRSAKKILSLVLSLAMICTIFSTFGITAFAEGAIEISDFATLKSTIKNATEPIEIDITADFVSDGTMIWVNNGKDITINLKGHTIEAVFLSGDVNPSTLTINGTGTVKGSIDRAYVIDFRQGSTLIANNVKIIGADATGENEHGKQGINIVNATAKLTNCYISSGKSTGTAENYPAFNMEGEAKCYVENCTFAKGGGGSQDHYYIVDKGGSRGKLYDFSGNEINFTDDCKTPIVIGTGYATPVDGDTIKDTDGTPAKGNSPVSATAAIPAPTYTVTIPETVNFGEQKQALAKYKNSDKDQYGELINVSKTFTISATNVDNLFDDLGKKPQIDVVASFDGTLKNDTSTIPYTVKKGNNAFTSGDVFCSFRNSSEVTGEQKAEGTVWINRTDITKTADFSGTMTFTISIPDAE